MYVYKAPCTKRAENCSTGFNLSAAIILHGSCAYCSKKRSVALGCGSLMAFSLVFVGKCVTSDLSHLSFTHGVLAVVEENHCLLFFMKAKCINRSIHALPERQNTHGLPS